LDCNVTLGQTIGVIGTGLVQKLEIGVGQVEQRSTKFNGEISTTLTVAVIRAFVDPSRIVENGEQLDHFDHGPRGGCQSQAVFENSGPMADAVVPCHGRA